MRVPTTDEIEDAWIGDSMDALYPEAQFKAWLAEHDAELIEKLADEMPVMTRDGFGTNRFASGKESRDWLRDQARQRREEQDDAR